MNDSDIIVSVDTQAKTIRNLAATDRYSLTIHAEVERRADEITAGELVAALSACDVIEDYPNDPRGASCLVLGFAGHRPIHAVCAVRKHSGELLLITTYDPSRHPEKWENNYRTRRRRNP